MATYNINHIEFTADSRNFIITEEHITPKEVCLSARFTDEYGNTFQLNRPIMGFGCDEIRTLRNAYENLWNATFPACRCYEEFRAKVYGMLSYYERLDEAVR